MKHGKQALIVFLCLTMLLLPLSGCFGSTSTGLLSRWKCGRPVAAVCYIRNSDKDIRTETLPAEQLPALIEMLDSMPYKTRGFHTDYFWHGRFGLELTLDDGTYWNYDGTCMELRSVSVLESTANEYRLHSSMTEVPDGGFTEPLRAFFSLASDPSFRDGW